MLLCAMVIFGGAQRIIYNNIVAQNFVKLNHTLDD